MAKRTIEICICDICKKETKTRTERILVRWMTDQTEGRSINPYITAETKDICEKCLDKITKVNACGAQGFNEYTILD